MAASKKRRRTAHVDDDGSSGSGNSESESEAMSETEVQVDFEARAPDDGDFHGIKRLLQQLFLKAHVNVSQLADLLIEQNNISSVIKQSPAEDMEVEGDDDDDDDDMEKDVVFGVFSVVNLMEKKDMDFSKEMKSFLLNQCQKVCGSEEFVKFEKMLGDEKNHIGLILSERFINIPPKISLPLYESLGKDMKEAVRKKKPFNFSYYMLISKILVDKKDAGSPEVGYVNAEEELFFEDAVFHFDYSVSEEQDSGLSGRWEDDDAEWQPKRRVMIFPAAKWDTLVSKLGSEFSVT